MHLPKRLFHYTVGIKLKNIQADGYLKTTPTESKLGERPLVWLSSNPYYEQTARKHFMKPGISDNQLGTLLEMDDYGNGVYRFSFLTDNLPEHLTPLPWHTLKHQSRMRKNLIDRLVKRAKGVKAKPREWYGVMDRIPVQLATLERLHTDSGQWVEISLSSAADEPSKHNVQQMLDNEVPNHLRSRDEQWKE